MLEEPNINFNEIIHLLNNQYGLDAQEITFLPVGADFNTAVFHILTPDNAAYFLKLRSGSFDAASVRLPHFLHQQGIAQIIPVIPTQSGVLWSSLAGFTTILYPFIAGKDGYATKLTPTQWHELGTVLHKIHSANYPPELMGLIQKETYPPAAREAVRQFLADSKTAVFTDPVAQETAVLLQQEHDTIMDLFQRAERLAAALQENPPPFLICHTDLHAGNLHITPDGKLYVVDWDQPLLAPKERDLMYVGSGLMASGLSLEEEERLFYAGYGRTDLNPAALAYYRYERIIQDIYEFCKELLLSDAGGADRAQSLLYLKSNFRPNSTIAIAYQADKTRKTH